MSAPTNDEAVEPGGREDRLLSWPEVAHIASISRSTAWRMERDGAFPPRVRVSPRRVGWWESELTTWKKTRGGQLPSPPLRAPSAPRLPGMPRSMPTLATASAARAASPPAPDQKTRPAPTKTRRRSKSGASLNQFDFGF